MKYIKSVSLQKNLQYYSILLFMYAKSKYNINS